MRVTIKKWGKSAVVRIPVEVLNAVRLRVGAVMDVRADKGRIVIERVQAEAYDLEALISAITPDNMHAEVFVDALVCKESL